jgi:hypothetical protein
VNYSEAERIIAEYLAGKGRADYTLLMRALYQISVVLTEIEFEAIKAKIEQAKIEKWH